jgi:hypothetical protein
VLAKNSATNFDTGWVDQSGGGGITASQVVSKANALSLLPPIF